jgi:hypothetical protein
MRKRDSEKSCEISEITKYYYRYNVATASCGR